MGHCKCDGTGRLPLSVRDTYEPCPGCDHEAEIAALKAYRDQQPSFAAALALLFTAVCPEQSFDPTQPMVSAKIIHAKLREVTAALATAQNVICTAKDRLHVDYEHLSLPDGITAMRDGYKAEIAALSQQVDCLRECLVKTQDYVRQLEAARGKEQL